MTRDLAPHEVVVQARRSVIRYGAQPPLTGPGIAWQATGDTLLMPERRTGCSVTPASANLQPTP
ncbi:MAG TPA: hypothetical protein VGD83_15970 [Streptosporangiaceae bacterium]